jgi:HAD superfamily hydrolase (TIGR01458 family)
MPVEALLLDLDGVVYVGGELLPGSREAIHRLRAAGIPTRFITNTTRRSRRQIAEKLVEMGLPVAAEEIFTPAALACDQLRKDGLTPFLIAYPDLAEDFAGLTDKGRSAVVIGDAGPFFSYDRLNQAFRLVMHGAPLLALAKNRFFLDHDRELSLDAGAFVAALEYASGRSAIVFGKPAAAFFELAAKSFICPLDRVVMIGDDAESDVGGAKSAGLGGILVRTGKYRPGQEKVLTVPPDLVADDLKAVVDALLG